MDRTWGMTAQGKPVLELLLEQGAKADIKDIGVRLICNTFVAIKGCSNVHSLCCASGNNAGDQIEA